LSAQSPRWDHPHRNEIINRQLSRQSTTRERVTSLRMRRSELIDKLIQARDRLNRF